MSTEPKVPPKIRMMASGFRRNFIIWPVLRTKNTTPNPTKTPTIVMRSMGSLLHAVDRGFRRRRVERRRLRRRRTLMQDDLPVADELGERLEDAAHLQLLDL